MDSHETQPRHRKPSRSAIPIVLAHSESSSSIIIRRQHQNHGTIRSHITMLGHARRLTSRELIHEQRCGSCQRQVGSQPNTGRKLQTIQPVCEQQNDRTCVSQHRGGCIPSPPRSRMSRSAIARTFVKTPASSRMRRIAWPLLFMVCCSITTSTN